MQSFGVLGNGQLLIGDGAGAPTAATLTQSTGIAISNGAGSITVAIDGTVCTTAGNCAGVGGTGDVLQGGNSFSGTMTIGTNDTHSLVLETDGNAAFTINSSGNSTAAGTLAVQGASITVGTTLLQGGLVLHDGNGQTGTIRIGDITTSGVYTIPATAGTTDTFCMVTLANCAGSAAVTAVNSLTGAITIQGTTNEIEVSTASPNITVGLPNDVTISNSLTVSNGFIVSAGGASVTGGIDNNGDGITNAGAVSGATTIDGSGNINTTGGAIQTNSTTRIDNSGNLSNIGTITTSGAINSQTISSTANFTGTLTVQGANSVTLGATGAATGAALFKGSTAASGTITLIAPNNPTNNTITLPSETGTICTTGSVCTGYQPAGSYQVAGSYAATDLSNLASVAINTNLLPGLATIDLGSNASPFRDLYLGGTATNNFRLTGTALAARTLTIPDASGTFAVSASGNIALSAAGNISFTGVLPIANGGTNASDATTARSNLGAAASGANSDITSLSGLTTALSVAQGGTGAATFTSGSILYGNGTGAIQGTGVLANGQLLIGDGTGAPTVATITQGSGIIVTNGAGSITVEVDSTVCLTSGNCAGVGGSGDILNNGQNGTVRVGSNNANAMILETNNTDRLTISSDGNATYAGGTTGNAFTISNSTSTGNILLLNDNATNVVSIADGGAAIFKNSVNSTTAFQVQPSGSTTPVFNVDTQNGRVGIGLAAPLYKLHVSSAPATTGGIIKISDTSATGSNTTFGGLELGSPGNTDDYIVGKKTVNTTGYFQVRHQSGSELLTIDGTGNVTASGTITSGLINGQTISSAANFTGTLAVQGASTTIGTTALQGSLLLHDGTGETASIRVGNIAASGVYTIPAASGAADSFCMVTLANCAGAGSVTSINSLAGALTIQGTANEVEVSTSSPNITIGLPDDVTIGDDLTVTDVLTATSATLNGNLTFGEGANRTASVASRATNAAGNSLTIFGGSAGAGATGVAGGSLVLGGGNAAGTTGNANGGDVLLYGGTAVNSGTAGNVILGHNGTSAVGNVGIGTNTPGSKLTVSGTGSTLTSWVGVASNNQVESVLARSESGGTFNNSWSMYMGASSQDLNIWDNAASASVLTLQATSRNVGIGDTTPNARLHVSSSGTDVLFRVTDETATAQDVLNIADGGATTFRNQTDSSNAFQIRNADGSTMLFNADTSLGHITMDADTSVYLDAATLNARLIYHSSLNDTELSNTNSGGKITLTTDGAFRIWDGGNTYLSMTNTGATTFQNDTDSTTAFQIQRAGSGGALFIADTSSSRIYIGPTAGDTIGAVLVLGNKTNSGDPTGVEGAMYYNNAEKTFRCYRDGAWSACATFEIDHGFSIQDEFFGTAVGDGNIGEMGWRQEQIGAAACNTLVYNPTTLATTADRPGILVCNTTATANTGATLRLGQVNGTTSGNTIVLAAGNVLKTAVAVSTTTSMMMRIGAHNQTTTTTAPTAGVWWEFDPSQSANWRYCYGDGTATPQCANSSTAATASTFFRFEIRITATGAGTSAATYIVNGTSHTVSSATIATSAATNPYVAPAFTCYTTTTAARSCFIDYYQLRGKASAVR